MMPWILVPKNRFMYAADFVMVLSNINNSSKRLVAYRRPSNNDFVACWAIQRRCKSTATASSASSSVQTRGVSPWIQYTLNFVRTAIDKRKKDRVVVDTPNRPQSSWERVKNFPEGVRGIVRDCLDYHTIHSTPQEEWKVEIPPHSGSGKMVSLGRIPRRQYEQQRQLRNDFRAMLPLLIIWIPPIIGFIPPILAIFAPRQVMSRHFHNPYEREIFAQIEYGQRLRTYNAVATMVRNSI